LINLLIFHIIVINSKLTTIAFRLNPSGKTYFLAGIRTIVMTKYRVILWCARFVEAWWRRIFRFAFYPKWSI